MAREFNPRELGEIQKLTSSITKEMDRMLSQTDKRNKQLDDEIKATKEILENVTDEKEAREAIGKLKKQQESSDNKSFGVNKKIADNFKVVRSINRDMLDEAVDATKAYNKVQEAAGEIGNELISSLDSMQDMASEVPVIGGLLGKLSEGGFNTLKDKVGGIVEGFQGGFTKGFDQIRSNSGSVSQAVAGGLGNGFRAAGKAALQFGKFLLSPAGIVTMMVAGLAAGVAAFAKLEASAKKFREETGLLASNTLQTTQNIIAVKQSTAEIGASFEDVAQAAADFTNEFRGIQEPSQEVLKSLVILNKNFGISTSEASKVNGIFQDISGASQEAAQFLTAQTVELANQAGVAPSQVIKDIADNAETAAIFFGGSARELASAAIEAAALGTSLTEAAKVSDNLLDFESSINAELEASAMLGQSINFNKARELAANNDIVGAQQAVLDQLESTVDLNKLNKFQLDSIAKASGMEVGELRKQLRLRQRFGGQDKERLKAAQQLLETGKKLEDITESDLATQNRRNQQQQELQGLTDELKNTFGAMGSSIMDALAPVGKVILQLLNLAGKILLPVFKIVGSILGAVFNTIGSIISVVYGIVMGIIDAIMPFFDMVSGFFSSIGSFFGAGGDSIGRDARADIGGSTQGSEYSATPMAKGGIVTGPTNALIGEAGPEAVIPLGGDVMGSGAIVSAIEKLGNDIRALQVQVNMDGKKVSDGVSKVVSRNQTNSAGVTL